VGKFTYDPNVERAKTVHALDRAATVIGEDIATWYIQHIHFKKKMTNRNFMKSSSFKSRKTLSVRYKIFSSEKRYLFTKQHGVMSQKSGVLSHVVRFEDTLSNQLLLVATLLGVKLTTRLHPMPMLRMRAALSEHSHMSSWAAMQSQCRLASACTFHFQGKIGGRIFLKMLFSFSFVTLKTKQIRLCRF
jgi:hypothetical protein